MTAQTGPPRRWSRRRVLAVGAAGGVAVLAGGAGAAFELVSNGILPGQQALAQLDGACAVSDPPLALDGAGRAETGTFWSRYRRRRVGWTLAFPPGHPPGAAVPLVVMLHGFGGNHTNALAGMSPRQAVALDVGGTPVALVTVDGGGGYWNPHPGDDPMAMVFDELIPLCQARGAGRAPHRIGAMGISMGGYGALLLAEQRPDVIRAVAAISPAIWTSYGQARAANAGAYAGAADFAACDVVTHTAALAATPVRVASGADDPFHPGVRALAARLGPDAVVDVSAGCHTNPFFRAQEPPSLAFLRRHLVS